MATAGLEIGDTEGGNAVNACARIVQSRGTLLVVGVAAAGAGGAGRVRGAVRVVVWSALALLLTAGVGRLLGEPV